MVLRIDDTDMERNTQASLDSIHEGLDRAKALRAIAGLVGWTRDLAAILDRQTMAAGRIGFLDMALGQTMEAKEQMIERLP